MPKMKIDSETPPISEIIPGLFIADQLNFYNESLLPANNVNAVISLVADPVVLWQLPRFINYVTKDCHLWIKCLDSSTQDLLVYMEQTCTFIDNALKSPTSSTSTENSSNETDSLTRNGIIVHCERGVSRSPTIVIAYLMWKRKLPRDEAVALVKAKRKVKPNANFLDQLQVWEEVNYTIWVDAVKTIPRKPYQAYLERRAVRLKEKGLTGNEYIGMRDL